ncbi:MAG: hypothetical protein Q9191_008093, partial [Dirinaria sp. TL-2023a]
MKVCFKSDRLNSSNTQSSPSYRPSSARRPDSQSKPTLEQRPLSSKEYDSSQWPSLHALQSEPTGSNGQGLSRERPNAIFGNSSDRKRYYPPRTSLNSSRARKSSVRGTSPDLRSASEGRQYLTDSPGPRTSGYRQLGHQASASVGYDSSPLNAYSTVGSKPLSRRGSRAEGTESTVSTTAPSMVWEELSDLRSRLNRLELTGKLSGSGSRNGVRERPATATTTTTMTTMSSSPKHRRLRSGSAEASTVKGMATRGTHPLLRSALERSKDIVSPKVFEALEATALDALALAAMTNEGDPNVNVDSSSYPDSTIRALDRPLRRKADGLCRSLTELCIALCDANETDSTKLRPQSRDTTRPTNINGVEPENSVSFRAVSLEPDQTRVSSRAMSRFEARRSSMQALNATTGGRIGSSHLEPTATLTQQQQQQQQQPIPTPSSRASSVLLRRRTNDGERERPLSRAMTQVSHSGGQQRPSPREYTSHHPLPQLSPSIQSTAAPQQRKSYFSTPRWSPSNSSAKQQQQQQQQSAAPRRYLEPSASTSSTPPSSSASEKRLAQARQQRLT